VKKSEKLKNKRKIKFKCFLLAHILTLFFVAGNFSFAADLPALPAGQAGEEAGDNSYFGQKNTYSEPFSKLIELLKAKKKEIENYGGNFGSAKSFLINNNFNNIKSAPESNFANQSFLSAAFESIKSFVNDKPKQYFGDIIDSAKNFIFPEADKSVFEDKSANDEENIQDIENLRQQYDEAINETNSLNQKFILLQSELGKIKAGGIVVKEPSVNQKVIEKTIEAIISLLSSSDSDSDSEIASVRNELNNLNTNLLNKINNLSVQSSDQNTAAFQAISLTNRIDNLSGTKLTNITVSGVSGLADADIPDGITVSNYLPLAGGTLTGSLTGTSASFSSTLTVSASTTFNGVEYKWPSSDGTANQALVTNGAGGLLWTTITGGGSGVPDWNKQTNYGALTLTPTTTIPIWAKDAFYASSTSVFQGLATFGNASTSQISATNSYLGNVLSGTWNGSAVGTQYGGTGWSNITANTLLLGNGAGRIATTTAGTDGYVLGLSAGVPTWLATSTLSTITGTLTVAKGGTGQTSFGQGWLHSDGTTLTSSTSPTVAYLTATSTTATSTLTDLNFPATANIFYGGQRFLTASTSVAGNLTIGYQTPTSIDANGGLYNTGVGYQALGNATSTGYNTAIGYQALKGSATVPSIGSNTAIGYQTLFSNTTGIENIGNGYRALYANTTGNQNVANGAVALRYNTTGSGNVANGYNAGTGLNTAGTADQRSVIDDYMTFIGYQASRDASIASTTALTNGTAIGKNARVALSNSIVLGGTGSDAVSVAIGTTSPWAKLSIQNTYGSLLPLFDIASSTSAGYATSSMFRINADGNVGISTTSPNWKLSVAGIGSFDDFVRASYFTATSTTASTFPYASTTALTVSGSVYLGSLNGPLQANNGLVSATTSVGTQYGGTGLDSSALTGLAQIVSGTWSASSTLSAAYGGTGWNSLQANTLLLGNGAGRIATTTSGTDGYVLALSAGVPTWLATSTLSTITGTLTVAKGGTGQTSFGQGWLHSDGNTLTSSTSPTVAYLTATSTTATSTFAGGLSVAGSSGLTVLQNGKVGIGTTSPSGGLHILNQGATADRTSIDLDTTAGDFRRRTLRYLTDNSLRWAIDVDNAAETGSDAGSIFGINRYSDTGSYLSTPFSIMRNNEYIRLGTTGGRVMIGGNTLSAPGNMLSVVGNMAIGANYGQNNAATTDGLIIEGNVGIGTTSPYAKLSVAGDTALDSMFINFASSSAPSLTLNYLKSATSTIPSDTNYAWSIATSTTASPIFSISTQGSGANLNATTTINGGLNLDNGAILYDYSSGITSINSLEAGPMNFDDNAGIVSWMDLDITSASAVNTIHSYTAQIDSNPILTVYGESDGVGTTKNLRVGIGTSTPLHKLSIHNATTTADADLGFTATSTGLSAFYNWTIGIDISDAGKFKIASSTALGTSDRLVIDGNGNFGIGTSSPWRTLSVTGTVGFSSTLSATTTNAYDLCIDAATFEVTQRTTDCSGASSLRYKQNVEKLSYGLDDLMKLNPVSFQYTETFAPTDRKRKIGFIAEEVAPLIPEVVAYDDLGRPDSIDYPKMTSLLAKAIQELNIKVIDLEATVASSSASLSADEAGSSESSSSLFSWIIKKFGEVFGIVFEKDTIKAKNICVGETCVTEDQFKAVFANSQSSSQVSSSSSEMASSSSSQPVSLPAGETGSSSSSSSVATAASSSSVGNEGSSSSLSSSSESSSSSMTSSESSQSSISSSSSDASQSSSLPDEQASLPDEQAGSADSTSSESSISSSSVSSSESVSE